MKNKSSKTFNLPSGQIEGILFKNSQKTLNLPPLPPVSPLPVLVDPLVFNLDSENFNEEHFEDGINEEDISKGYYVAHVHIFL